jgi:hypothetical protein
MVLTQDLNQALLTAENKVERVHEFTNYYLAVSKLSKYAADAVEHSTRPQGEFIHLDVSINNQNGDAEFRVMQSGRYLVSSNKIHHCTPNLAEFLALVEAHKYAVHYGIDQQIYCDNIVAIKWFRKEFEVTIPPAVRIANPLLPQLIDKAVEYVKAQPESENNRVQFWDSSLYGQIPSDYGRKAPPPLSKEL